MRCRMRSLKSNVLVTLRIVGEECSNLSLEPVNVLLAELQVFEVKAELTMIRESCNLRAAPYE